MGRAFEYRKARKMKRWGNMSRTFTKIGKEITICVKAAGPDPTANSRLRALLQNARAANMPKDTIERAIKKATDKDASDYKEIVYEGYGPFGIAVVVETATDNNTRTVANVRSYFNKYDVKDIPYVVFDACKNKTSYFQNGNFTGEAKNILYF